MKLFHLPVKKETVPFGEFTYTLYRTTRRTIGIQVRPDGEIVVRAPHFCSGTDIRNVVASRADWIRQKREIMARAAEESDRPESHYFDGALLPFCGGYVRLRIDEGAENDRYRITLHEAEDGKPELLLQGATLDPETCKLLVARWGRRYAGDLFRDRVARWAGVVGVDYNTITIKDTKTRWGSCSAAGNINLHWRLIMLPERLSDYVIVHELCHRVEMNHSKLFWEHVGSILPDHKERRKELRAVERDILNW